MVSYIHVRIFSKYLKTRFLDLCEWGKKIHRYMYIDLMKVYGGI